VSLFFRLFATIYCSDLTYREEGVAKLENSLHRKLTADEFSRLSVMYQRIEGARASVGKGVCRGRVSSALGDSFEHAINGCRAKAWMILRQKILYADNNRWCSPADLLEKDVAKARELIQVLELAKKREPGRARTFEEMEEPMTCNNAFAITESVDGTMSLRRMDDRAAKRPRLAA
jgi:hypothetical protein